ncbi:nucleoside hydrolase [Cyclobacterium sp. 1_MG-2023]|uniref:nucleoside hydrolase n=1 Tax=Cyclobacterium sp. 1_MG-2023 TaxID=3062681 RepID=UPI0026E199EB|nr:nucleoside hydrolase [Cyclobacterium sp. 1_MG-2023]MDO6438668.1 nucleoside hydrolase [Cyclobacterium sp. 1_MG-2023]
MVKKLIFLSLITVLAYSQTLNAQSKLFFGTKETVPTIPEKGEQLKVIIVSDASNEIDDVWAISLALMHPDRFNILGFVGSNYDHTQNGIGPKSIETSVKTIETILQKAGLEGKYPVYPGGHPMQYEFTPSKAEGIDFIIEKAMECSPEDPLWIIGLGSPTDLASAYLAEPRIKDRVIMFWHARTENTWPYRAHNYNIKGDIHASRMMFHAPFPLIIFDTGTHLNAGTLEETELNIKPYGDLGEYLYDYRFKSDYYMRVDKGYFDLGDIAALVDPEIAKWQVIECPTVTQYMDYNFFKTNGNILRCYDIDRDKTFSMLYQGMKENYGSKAE